jgi:DNA-binding transcriptional ArsR family regulator
MINGLDVACVAALLGDTARANILSALMDGRAKTSSELAFYAGVSAATTSSHLRKLTEANFLSVEVQGRHRYYRITNVLVAQAIESLTLVAAESIKPHRRTGPKDAEMCMARTCYDHLAGRLGVGVTEALVNRGHLQAALREFRLTESGHNFLGSIGIRTDHCQTRRSFCRSCLDWSEQRPHAGGQLGAAIATGLFEMGWIERLPDIRAVRVTETGVRRLKEIFDLDLSLSRSV